MYRNHSSHIFRYFKALNCLRYNNADSRHYYYLVSVLFSSTSFALYSSNQLHDHLEIYPYIVCLQYNFFFLVAIKPELINNLCNNHSLRRFTHCLAVRCGVRGGEVNTARECVFCVLLRVFSMQRETYSSNVRISTPVLRCVQARGGRIPREPRLPCRCSSAKSERKSTRIHGTSRSARTFNPCQKTDKQRIVRLPSLAEPRRA